MAAFSVLSWPTYVLNVHQGVIIQRMRHSKNGDIVWMK